VPGEALPAVSAAAITLAELTWDLSWTIRGGRDRTPVIPSHEVSGMAVKPVPRAACPAWIMPRKARCACAGQMAPG
jgi:hypothetical protein